VQFLRTALAIISLFGVIAPQALFWYWLKAYGWVDYGLVSFPTALAATSVLFMVSVYFCGDPIEIIQWARPLSKYASGHLCARVLEWQQHDEVKEYCRTVTGMGRDLLYYDYLAIQKWVTAKQDEEDEKKAAAACRAIHSV